jgi:two-component system, NarL family, invasion response regulator UvrY
MATYIEVNSERPPHELLSNRELQVLMLLGGGKSVGDIAGELALSAKTIRTYRARLLEKNGYGDNRPAHQVRCPARPRAVMQDATN